MGISGIAKSGEGFRAKSEAKSKRVETELTMTETPAFQDVPPQSEHVTDYDEAHFVTYLRLLDGAAEGADWREVVRLVFGLDPADDPDAARAMHAAHLERARWMARSGYRQLIAKD